MAKKDTEKKKELARILYMNGEGQQQIADRVGISRATAARWIENEGWRQLRSAKTITRVELINKMLLSMDKLLNEADKAGDAERLAVLGDKLSKIAATINKLDKKTNVVGVVEVCIAFAQWLEVYAENNKDVSREFLGEVNRLQDLFIKQKIAEGDKA